MDETLGLGNMRSKHVSRCSYLEHGYSKPYVKTLLQRYQLDATLGLQALSYCIAVLHV